jgi:hypothetical protein
MAIEWKPHYIGTSSRVFEVEARFKDNKIEIWSYLRDNKRKYYFNILTFKKVNGVNIKLKTDQLLDFNEGFDSLEECQDFVEKLLKQD